MHCWGAAPDAAAPRRRYSAIPSPINLFSPFAVTIAIPQARACLSFPDIESGSAATSTLAFLTMLSSRIKPRSIRMSNHAARPRRMSPVMRTVSPGDRRKPVVRVGAAASGRDPRSATRCQVELAAENCSPPVVVLRHC